MNAFIAGFSMGLSLIIAIGSQNAFVLRQGLKHEHIFIVCLICTISDTILIILGVSGFSALMSQAPWLEPAARYFGAAFLFAYGSRSFWLAVKNTEGLVPSNDQSAPLGKVIAMCFAFAWLNPHVYLDTVFLLGAISTHYEGAKVEFALGGVIASTVFFFTLGYGAKALSPIFKKPNAWKVLDGLIGLLMWSIAFSLVREDMQSLMA